MKAKKLLFLLIFAGIAIVSCAPNHVDLHDLIVRKAVPIPPTNFYMSVAWFDEHHIGLVFHLEEPEAGYPIQEDILSIYDLESKKLVALAMPKADFTCNIEGVTPHWRPDVIRRAKDRSLSVITSLSCDPSGGPNLLLKYVMQTNDFEVLTDYNRQRVGLMHFTFVSDTTLVQEKPVGHPMSNELYKVSIADGSMVRLVPDFLRARWPTWSEKNQLVAFWGTAKYPGKEPKDLYTFNDIANLVRAPWDIYVMDQAGENLSKIHSKVNNIGALAWSPNGNILAFGGTVDDLDGIWLLDMDNPQPVRIYEQNEAFDWSPDGKEIMVVETKEFDAANNDVQIKAFILELPNCVFESLNACK